MPEDEIWGDGRDDHFDRGDSTDDEVIYTFAGDDVVILGTGDNTVFAGIGNDEVYGNAGDDLIVAGDGNDIVFGGGGDDEIHLGDGADFVDGGAGADFIFLTDDAQTDTIGLHAFSGHDVVDGFDTTFNQVDVEWAGLSFGDLAITYSADGG